MHPGHYARLFWIAALACLVALVYWPSTLFLYGKWMDTAGLTYTHGWLILLICLWLLAAARRGLVVPRQPLIFWLSVTAAFGWAVGRLLLFPVAFLYFAVNVWYGAPLQKLTVLVMRGVLAVTGPPALIV